MSDGFYIIKRNKPNLSPAVVGWLKTLKASARNRNPAGYTVFRQTLDYLENQVLNPAREKRAHAKAAEERLRQISSHWQPATGSDLAAGSDPLDLKLPVLKGAGALGAAFSRSGDNIQPFTVGMLMKTRKPEKAIIQCARLGCCAVSAAYISACLSSVPLYLHLLTRKCYIYPLAEASSLTAPGTPLRIYHPRNGMIQKVSMSSEADLVAFVSYSGGGSLEATVCLFRMGYLVNSACDR